MFFIESSLRKWLKYGLILMILCISILLIFEIYGKYIAIYDFQTQQKKYETQYNQYIKRVNQQREEFKEFFEFLIENDLYLIEFDYSYSGGIKAKVSSFLEPSTKIVSKYEIIEISKLKINDKYYVVLEISQ